MCRADAMDQITCGIVHRSVVGMLICFERSWFPLSITVNKHQWDDLHFFHKCGHPEMSKREENSYKWLNSGSPAHVALEEVVTNKKLLKDLAKLTEFHHTGELGWIYLNNKKCEVRVKRWSCPFFFYLKNKTK